MVKVLNILTNGLLREGITTTQLEYMRYIDKVDLQIDMAVIRRSLPDVIQEFKKQGCGVVNFPDRDKQFLSYVWELYRKMKTEHYDVVHVHGSSSFLAIEMFVAKFAGVKKRIAHSRNTRNGSPTIDRICRPIFYRSYTHALACGREAGEFLFGGRPFDILYNGKDFDKFYFSEAVREEYRKELSLGNILTLGFVGNLNEQKNPMFLLDIVAEICVKNPNVKLLIIGDGCKQEDMKIKCAELEIQNNVIFVGRVSNVNDYLHACDIMLLPSLYEGLPNVVLEWQIAGLPALVSDKVTQECAVTDLVSFLPINEGVAPWVSAILNQKIEERDKRSKLACQRMKDAGFEIKESAKRLKRIYMD